MKKIQRGKKKVLVLIFNPIVNSIVKFENVVTTVVDLDGRKTMSRITEHGDRKCDVSNVIKFIRDTSWKKRSFATE